VAAGEAGDICRHVRCPAKASLRPQRIGKSARLSSPRTTTSTVSVGQMLKLGCIAGGLAMSADIRSGGDHVRFSNRPVGVKRFQTIHHCSVDVARGLALLSGIGTRALPSWDPRTRRNNLWRGLGVKTSGPSGHANSPHPSSREGHHSTAGWSSSFLLSDFLYGFHAATPACSRLHRNSVPSTQMRCMITASRRASATIAFFIPRCLAIFIAQAFSQDHFLERIMA
jgi:hypothetical protein